MTTQTARLVRVETKMEDICNKLDDHILEQREDFDKVMTKLDSLEARFAGKWVEKAAIGLIIVIISAIVLYGITVV